MNLERVRRDACEDLERQKGRRSYVIILESETIKEILKYIL